MKISKLSLAISLSFVFFGYSQNKLTGHVVDLNNRPVAKAKIFLDSIYSKVVTNKKGDFEVIIPEKVNTINIYSDDYGLLSSKYNHEDKMNFVFSETVKSNKDKKESHISLVYSKTDQKYVVIQSNSTNTSTDKRMYNNIYEMIRSKVAGVSVSNDNKITVRGFSSIKNLGEPLFVVNGMVISNISFLIPSNVKSIEFLKDAEASVYGSRGSNGVLVITTKN